MPFLGTLDPEDAPHEAVHVLRALLEGRCKTACFQPLPRVMSAYLKPRLEFSASDYLSWRHPMGLQV